MDELGMAWTAVAYPSCRCSTSLVGTPEAEVIEWEKGLIFQPTTGPCHQHLVEVLNVDVMLFQRGMAVSKEDIETGEIVELVTQEEVNIEMPSVMVRCRDDLKSWSFPMALDMPEECVVYRPSTDEYAGEVDEPTEAS